MSSFKDLFVDFLKEHDIKFRDLDERAVRLSFHSDTVPNGVTVYVIFDSEDNNGVHFTARDFAIVPKDKYAAVLLACNEANAKYRWVKFYINDSFEIVLDEDAVIDRSSVGQECAEVAFRISDILDDAYGSFMKAIYS